MNIDLLKEKLRKLIELNPDGDFGYINNALSEKDVETFEEKHKIKFPNDFRTFITQMFDGGFGPHQIMPLEYWDSIHNTVYLDSLGNDLSKPFPLVKAWDEEKDKELMPDRENYNSIVNGTIRICHIGCGNFIFLVVNGREYGNMWIDDRASNGEIIPLTSKGENRVTFEEWYFDWVDSQIEYYSSK